jgi:hypothetical protein
MNFQINRLVLCFIVACVFPNQAFAYVDPGSGALLLQMLIGGGVGALFYLRIYWSKIKTFIFWRRKPEQSDEK